MRVWAVANQKGGVGKTTTVVSLGGELSRRGYRTLVVDMDPHGSMTAYFGHDPDNMDNSLYQLFKARADKQRLDPQSVIQETRFKDLFLLPAATALATLDRQLSGAEGMGLVITHAMRELEAGFDFVLIDCPPQLGMLMVNALAACEHLIIPVQTEFLALKGLERMERTLAMMQQARRKAMTYTILPTMFDRRTRASVGTLRQLREQYPGNVWRYMIPVDTQFREASRRGVPLSINNPKDRGSQAYSRFLDDLLGVDRQEQVPPSQAAQS